MSARDEILRAIRTRLPPASELPSLEQNWIRFPDRATQFRQTLESVGGKCLSAADAGGADAILRELPAWAAARKTLSLVPGVGRSTFDLNAVDDPHDLEDVEFAVLPGRFGVAENGAVWVTDEGLKHRVLYFLVQHLALVVPASELVDTMHAAYERLSFSGRGFGAFVSGPSKTADIEQSLVIGAHGARSTTVILVGEA